MQSFTKLQLTQCTGKSIVGYVLSSRPFLSPARRQYVRKQTIHSEPLVQCKADYNAHIFCLLGGTDMEYRLLTYSCFGYHSAIRSLPLVPSIFAKQVLKNCADFFQFCEDFTHWHCVYTVKGKKPWLNT